MKNWRIEYGNDTGQNDDCFVEWWEVTNDDKYFRCDSEEDAIWLANILNTVEP